MNHISEHDRIIQKFYDVRLACLQEQRDFRREKASLDKDYGLKLDALTKKYSEKYGQTLNGFSTVSSTQKGVALPTATLIRSFIDQSKHLQLYRDNLLKWEAVAKGWQTAADEMLQKVVEPLRAEQDRTRSESEKNEAHLQALVDVLVKTKKELDKAHTRYQEAYNSHQKLQMTDKKWQPSYNTLIQKKITYLLSLESYNSLQAQLFDLTLPEYENFLAEQDRLMQAAQKALYECDLKITRQLSDKVKDGLGDLSKETSAFDPTFEMTFLMTRLNEGAPLNFELASFTNTSSENDSPYFTRDPVAVTFLVKQYTILYEKLELLKKDLDKAVDNVSTLHSLMVRYQEDSTLGSYEKAYQVWLDAKKAESFLQLQEVILTSQLSHLSNLLRDEFETKLHQHEFKNKGISMNSICDHCGTSIWGISGASLCQACGYLCHTKCTPMVQPFCGLILTAEESQARRGKKVPPPRSTSKTHNLDVNFIPVSLSPRLSHTSLGAKLAALPSPTQSIIASFPKASVLYTFTAAKEDELSIEEGDAVHVTGQVDEDGWIKVRRADGRQGLVPSNYLDLVEVAESLKSSCSLKDGSVVSAEGKRASQTVPSHVDTVNKPETSVFADKLDRKKVEPAAHPLPTPPPAAAAAAVNQMKNMTLNKKTPAHQVTQSAAPLSSNLSSAAPTSSVPSSAAHTGSYSHSGIFVPSAFVPSGDQEKSVADLAPATLKDPHKEDHPASTSVMPSNTGQHREHGKPSVSSIHSKEVFMREEYQMKEEEDYVEAHAHLEDKDPIDSSIENPSYQTPTYMITPETPPTILFTTTVLYDYTAQEPDELSIEENQIIDVLQVNSDGWCLARSPFTLKVGHVPLNYLETVNSSFDHEPETNLEVAEEEENGRNNYQEGNLDESNSVVEQHKDAIEPVYTHIEDTHVEDHESPQETESLTENEQPAVSSIETLEARLAKLRHH